MFSALPISSLFPFLYFIVSIPFSLALPRSCYQPALISLNISSDAGRMALRILCLERSSAHQEHNQVAPKDAAFMLGRALTSVAWGAIADRIGRKPVIVFGTISVLLICFRQFSINEQVGLG